MISECRMYTQLNIYWMRLSLNVEISPVKNSVQYLCRSGHCLLKITSEIPTSISGKRSANEEEFARNCKDSKNKSTIETIAIYMYDINVDIVFACIK